MISATIRIAALAVGGVMLALHVRPGSAQSYPQRPITLINPAAAGGFNEIVKAVVFDKVARALGVPIVMEAKGGGGGMVGAMAAVGAEPDGYTLLLAGASITATNPVVRKDVPYDPLRDFTPIVMLADAQLMLVVNAAVPAKDAREFVALARARPGQLDYGSYGQGSTSHLGFELFRSVAGIDVVHVPYRGSAPLLAAMRAGEVQASFDFLPAVRSYAETGTMRILGLAADRRSALIPEVPTLTEQGYPVIAGGALMVLAPAGLPVPIADRLNAEINKVLALPDVRQRLGEIGFVVVGGTREQASRQIATDLAKWRKLAREINLEPQ